MKKDNSINYLRIDEFKNFIDNIESILLDNSTFFEEELKENKLHEVDILEVRKYYRSFRFRYPTILRNSLFISIFSFFENELNQLCNLYKIFFNSTISLEDISGKGIVKAKKYLEKVVGLNLDSLNTEWSILANYKKIRNSLVHNDGKFKSLDELSKILDNVPEIEKSEDLFIYIKAKFLNNFLLLIEKYLRIIRIIYSDTLLKKHFTEDTTN